jgi:hypothetical protein
MRGHTIDEARTVASCEWLAGEAENGERRERQSDLEKNRMEEPDEEVAQNARRIYIAAETK